MNLDVDALRCAACTGSAAAEKRSNVAQILASGVSMPDALRAADRWPSAGTWPPTSGR